ncbi:hypothetical protein KM043_000165 [Ampulex compressa]|nr:hypothetical protein KM043_000165 [Ampulex compressa]
MHRSFRGGASSARFLVLKSNTEGRSFSLRVRPSAIDLWKKRRACDCASQDMWPLLATALRRVSVYVQIPVACVIGLLGYKIEGWISDRYTPATAPIVQQRQERLLQSMDSATTKKQHSPLEVNLSPSLST